MDIQPATRAHLPAILEIERNTFSIPWSERSFCAELDSADAFFAVAVPDGGTACGFCILHRFGDEGEIFNIAVAGAMRGRGIGTQLLAAALEHAAAAELSRVFLEVRESNFPARELYRSFGFFEVGRRKNYYDEPAEDAVLMQWNAADIGDDTLC